jgi:hypothetical protein
MEALEADEEQGDKNISKIDETAKRKQASGDKDGDSFKKQLKSASELAKQCKWVLDQLSQSRISESAGTLIDETHFQAVHLAPSEISWLKDHDSLDKVLHLTCLAYAAAPKWEPYPQGLLSVQDLQKMESEKEAHRKAVEEANRLAHQLLVRKGNNADPTQETVEYGMRNTDWVKAQLARAKDNSSKKKKKKGESVDALISAVTELHDGKCDVLECNEAVVGKCTDEMVSTSKCQNRSYCNLHIAHSSHDLQTLKDTLKVRYPCTILNLLNVLSIK